MRYTVSATDLSAIRLNESEIINSVLQNIAVILATPKGNVPLYREFGLENSFLDKPMPVAKVLMIAAVREAVEHWEPQATVVNVSFTEDAAQPGRLIPTVEVEIKSEQEQ